MSVLTASQTVKLKCPPRGDKNRNTIIFIHPQERDFLYNINLQAGIQSHEAVLRVSISTNRK